MLSDLGEALADIALKLGVWVRNKCSQVGDSTLINNCLSKLFSMFRDFRKSSCSNAFQSQLWLLNAKDKETNGSSIDNGLGKLVVVLCNAGERKCCSFLYRGVKLFQAVDQSIKGS